MRMTTTQKRAKLVRILHIAKNDLMLSDEAYRKILANCSKGKISSKTMSLPELEEALQQMKALGFVVTLPKAARTNSTDLPVVPLDAQCKMIRGLWIELHELGAVRNSSEKALAAFVKRMTGVELLSWLDNDQSSQVIEHLKKWRQRISEVENG